MNLQTPLYPAYAAASGRGATAQAAVFALYVLALVPVLIGLNGMGGRWGRRPVVALAAGLSIAATLAPMATPDLRGLGVARVLQGLSVGLAVPNVAAWLHEAWPQHGSWVVATTTAIGFGGGALATSIVLATQGPAMPPATYAVTIAALAVCLLGVLASPGTPPGPGSLVQWPSWPRGAHWPGMAMGLGWTTSGLVVAVVPGVLAEQSLAAWSGPALFGVTGAAVLVHPLSRRLRPVRRIGAGLALLPVGTMALVGGATLGSVPALLVGALAVGVAAYSLIYLGGLDLVVALEGDRARSVAGFFLYAYAGFSVPVVGVGALVDAVGAGPALSTFVLAVAASAVALFLRSPTVTWRSGGSCRARG